MSQLSKKKKFVKDGLFYAEINEFLRRVLAEDGYAGVEIKPRPDCTQIVIKCTKTPEVVKRIPYIQKLLQLRHKFKSEEACKVFAEKVHARGLSARAQAQSICYKLKGGLAVRRACYGVLKYIMENGKAKGVAIVISGKLRGQRAKAMKFSEGYMIASGDAKNDYIVEAVEHVLLRQGTIGVRVKIMLPHDPQGKAGPSRNQDDIVIVHDPKVFHDEPEVEPQQHTEQLQQQGQEYVPQQETFQQPDQQQFMQQQQQMPPQGYDNQGYGQQMPPQQQEQQQFYGQQQQQQQPQYHTPGY